MGESSQTINPNNADLDDLTLLPGVGEALAERIIENRPFDSIDDMQRVPGLGVGTLKRLEPWIVIGEGMSLEPDVQDQGQTRAEETEPDRPEGQVLEGVTDDYVTRSQALGISAAAAGVGVVISMLLIISILVGINRTLDVSRHSAIRDLSGSVQTIRVQFADVEADLESINQRMSALEGLSGRMTELESETAELETDVSDALSQVQRMRTRVEQVSLQLEELTRQTRSQATFFERLQGLLSELFGGLNEGSAQ